MCVCVRACVRACLCACVCVCVRMTPIAQLRNWDYWPKHPKLCQMCLMRYDRQQSQRDQMKLCERIIIFLWWLKDVGLLKLPWAAAMTLRHFLHSNYTVADFTASVFPEDVFFFLCVTSTVKTDCLSTTARDLSWMLRIISSLIHISN